MNGKVLIVPLMAFAMSGAAALAQEVGAPPPPPPQDQRDGGGGGGGEGRGPRGPRPEMRQDGPGGRMGGDGRDGGMRGPGRDGGGGGAMGQVELLRGYLEVVDRFTHLSRDPSNAAIAAVISANEMLKSRGQDAVINYFTKLLPNVKNEAAGRAIRLELMQAYQASGQQDKALEQMEALITAPASGAGNEAKEK